MPSMTSQRLVFSARLTTPRWCGHHVYSTVAPRSLAITSAILFSRPSSFSFENGRLLGSPHTRSCFAASADARPETAQSSTSMTASLLASDGFVMGHRSAVTASWQLEHVDHATLGGVLVEPVLVRQAHCAERRVRIVGRQILRDRQSEPATNTGVHRDVLLLVRAEEGHRRSDDSRADLVLPQQLSGLGVHRLEPAVHRSVEHQVGAGREDAAPRRLLLLDAPHLLAGGRVPRDELAEVAVARAR